MLLYTVLISFQFSGKIQFYFHLNRPKYSPTKGLKQPNSVFLEQNKKYNEECAQTCQSNKGNTTAEVIHLKKVVVKTGIFSLFDLFHSRRAGHYLTHSFSFLTCWWSHVEFVYGYYSWIWCVRLRKNPKQTYNQKRILPFPLSSHHAEAKVRWSPVSLFLSPPLAPHASLIHMKCRNIVRQRLPVILPAQMGYRRRFC